MKIDEIEFQDKNGNEFEPTKNQLVIYIKSLHKQIKDLKETQKQLAINELVRLRRQFFDLFLCPTFKVLSSIIDKQIEELKGEKSNGKLYKM